MCVVHYTSIKSWHNVLRSSCIVLRVPYVNYISSKCHVRKVMCAGVVSCCQRDADIPTKSKATLEVIHVT